MEKRASLIAGKSREGFDCLEDPTRFLMHNYSFTLFSMIHYHILCSRAASLRPKRPNKYLDSHLHPQFLPVNSDKSQKPDKKLICILSTQPDYQVAIGALETKRADPRDNYRPMVSTTNGQALRRSSQ